jgi:hypothetical protein
VEEAMLEEYMWSKKHKLEFCKECGRNDIAHHSHGLCSICSCRKDKLIQSPYVPQTAWSRAYDSCVICGTTDFNHVAKGQCTECYRQWRKDRLEERKQKLNATK